MGLSKDIRTELEKWLETTKIEIMAKLDSVCKDLETRLLRAYDKLEEKVKVLEGENAVLCQRVEAMERYDRGDSLEFHNIPTSDNESPEDLILSITSKMGLNVKPDDISAAYRLPVKKEKQGKATPRLYVKFTKRKLKRAVYANRTKKPVTHQQLGFSSSGKIFIHEHLTKEISDLYFKAKDKIKEASYKYVWTQDLKIYVRYNESAKRIPITCEADLSKITEPRQLRSTPKTPHCG